MRTTNSLPVAGSLLSGLGLLAIVMAIVGGLLGMHVIGASPAMAMDPAPMAGAAATPTPVLHAAVPNHAASSTALPAAHPVADQAMPAHQGSPMDCGMSPSDGHSMAGHGTCVPTSGPDVLSVPLPGMLTRVHAGTAFTSAPGPKSRGRIPDPPSLSQLSILRT